MLLKWSDIDVLMNKQKKFIRGLYFCYIQSRPTFVGALAVWNIKQTNTNIVHQTNELNELSCTFSFCFRVARFADFIPEKGKSGDIEIACGNVENRGKFG